MNSKRLGVDELSKVYTPEEIEKFRINYVLEFHRVMKMNIKQFDDPRIQEYIKKELIDAGYLGYDVEQEEAAKLLKITGDGKVEPYKPED